MRQKLNKKKVFKDNEMIKLKNERYKIEFLSKNKKYKSLG